MLESLATTSMLGLLINARLVQKIVWFNVFQFYAIKIVFQV